MISTPSAPITKNNLTALNDEQLMELVADDSNQALEQLRRRYFNLCLNFATKLTMDRQLAKELVDTTFIKVWVSRDQYNHQRGTFKSWLMTIVRNLSFNAIRDRKRSRCVSLDALMESNLSWIKANDPSAESVAVNKLTNSLIMDLLDKLPSHYGEVLRLRMYDRSYDEIADTLKIHRGTVRSRINRAWMRMGKLPAIRELLTT